MKACRKCKKEKSLAEFYVRPSGRLRSECKSCKNKQSAEHYRQNKEQYCARGKKYFESNRERRRATNRSWYEKNRERKRACAKIWRDTPGEFQLNRRISTNLRCRVWHALKGKTKGASLMSLVGCTINQLRAHLENRFQSGMSWKNYGEWEIDHIKPCAKFDLRCARQQKLCFHFSNLQPLWRVENMQKGAK